MITRLTNICSQYLVSFVDSKGEHFDGSKTYKVTLTKDVPAAEFWSFIVHDNQTRSMLDTPQRYARAAARSEPGLEVSAAAVGAVCLLRKPFETRALLGCLKTALDV
jgi:hypothetical protein